VNDQKDQAADIPAVGKPNNNQLNKHIGFVLIVALAGVLIYSAFSDSTDEKGVNEQSSDYRIGSGASSRTFERKEPKPKRETKTSDVQTLTKAEMYKLLAEQKKAFEAESASKSAELAAKMEDAKRKSPTSIFKRSAPANNTRQIQPGSSNLFGTSLLTDQSSKEDRSSLNLAKPSAVDQEQAVKISDMGSMIAAGKFIRGVLETSIDSTLPGQVRAVVATDVYSENGSRVLIPKGSRLVGQYQSGIRQGQNRVFVIWSHVTTPTGIQVGLESAGTDALGTTGLTGDYDSHFFKRFGGALLLSVIEGVSQNNSDGIDINGGNALNRASSVALENSINIPPTIYVDQGNPINVFIARNLEFNGVL
jgi:type IV secretory pathway VirB10-like protein